MHVMHTGTSADTAPVEVAAGYEEELAGAAAAGDGQDAQQYSYDPAAPYGYADDGHAYTQEEYDAYMQEYAAAQEYAVRACPAARADDADRVYADRSSSTMSRSPCVLPRAPWAPRRAPP
jgi:hypothetical protein